MSISGFALSIQQRRVWDSHPDAHQTMSRILFSAPQDVGAQTMADRLRELTDRHEILRTRFVHADGFRYPLQVIGTGPVVRLAMVRPGVYDLEAPAMCCDAGTLVRMARWLAGGVDFPAETLQYADYSGWQNETAASTGGTTPEGWGRDEYQIPAAPRLITEGEGEGGIGRIAAPLVTRDSKRLRAVAAQLGVAIEDALLGLWMEHIRLLSGGASGVGLVLAARGATELETALGPYACCVPMQDDIRPGEPFPAVAQRLASRADAAERLLLNETPPGNAHMTARFECIEARAFPGRIFDLRHEAEPFHIKLNCLVTDADVRLEFSYDTARFTRPRMRRIAEQFVALLRSTMSNLERPAARTLPLGRREREDCLRLGRGVIRQWGSALTFPEAIEERARLMPNRMAVACGESQLTFAELNSRANRLARHLRSKGCGPEDRVALAVERSLDSIVAIVAILKTGAAYVPLDWAVPSRFQHAVEACGAKFVIAPAGVAGAEWIDPAEAAAIARNEPADDLGVAIDPRSLAYIIFTSGSTGGPKGVMIQHGSLMNLIHGLHETVYAASERSLVSVNAPLTFDSSVKQLGMLAHGYPLQVISESERNDPALLLERVRKSGIRTLDVTPSLLEVLLETAAGCGAALPERLLLGGEAVPERLWRQLGEECCNVYGPTECTVDATAARIKGDSVTIGTPLPNIRVYVVNELLEPAPIGCAGELVIGGEGVARGYVGDPALTAERFVPDPLSTQAGARLYRTGDVGRLLDDGSIQFLGRLDGQTKIRGFRVEREEVETVLCSLAGVQRACVAVAGEESRDHVLVAFYTGEAAREAEIAQQLAAQLPSYMVPGRILHVEEFPLTSHGKVDRAALLALAGTKKTASGEAPRTETELRLREMWMELLGCSAIGIRDDFFAMGGHSLMAMQLAARVRNTFHVDLALASIFEQPTIAALATLIDSSEKVPVLTAIPRARREPVMQEEAFQLASAAR